MVDKIKEGGVVEIKGIVQEEESKEKPVKVVKVKKEGLKHR